MASQITTISNNSETQITTSYSTWDSLVIANNHASAEIEIDLYLKDSSANKKYFLRNTKIPQGTALKLEKDEIHLDTETYGLYIISDNAGGGLDVFLRRNI